ASTDWTSRPSDAAYREAASPAGPAPPTITPQRGGRAPLEPDTSTPAPPAPPPDPRADPRVGRVAQDLAAARNHDRCLMGLDRKTAEQGLCFLVFLEVDPLTWQAVCLLRRTHT